MVTVVYNQTDGEDWANFIISQIRENVNNKDTTLCFVKLKDMDALTEKWSDVYDHLNANVWMIIVTPKLVDSLGEKAGKCDKFFFTPNHDTKYGVLLSCGVCDDEINQIKNNIPLYDLWMKDEITGKDKQTGQLLLTLSSYFKIWLKIQEPDSNSIGRPSKHSTHGSDNLPAARQDVERRKQPKFYFSPDIIISGVSTLVV